MDNKYPQSQLYFREIGPKANPNWYLGKRSVHAEFYKIGVPNTTAVDDQEIPFSDSLAQAAERFLGNGIDALENQRGYGSRR